MTLQQYIHNPAGSKASVISNRKMFEDLYRDKWGKIMTRENGHVDYKLYIDKNRYIAHLRIPSEAIDKFYYDVVFLFSGVGTAKRLDQCEVRFFSNDPSFNYTFAYAFKKHDMCIKELESRMSKTALKKRPLEKNPDNAIGYVKSFYFAYIYMSEKGLLNLAKFKAEAEKMNWKIFTQIVELTDDKVAARQEAGNLLKKKEKKEREAVVPFGKKDVKHPEVHAQSMFMGNITRTSKIGNVTHAKKTHGVSRGSRIKKAKRI